MQNESLKMHLIYELTEDDPDKHPSKYKRINQGKPQLGKSYSFSDENTFCLKDTVNGHNHRYWSNENPQWVE